MTKHPSHCPFVGGWDHNQKLPESTGSGTCAVAFWRRSGYRKEAGPVHRTGLGRPMLGIVGRATRRRESSGWPFIHTGIPVISIVLFQMAHHLFQTAGRKGSSARAAPHSYHPLSEQPL
ncbi:uncharacterized [Tachysurus ichikawai]